MKKYLYISLLILFTYSCDIIPESERFLEIDNTPKERVILLEDYTGQRCINCPDAAKEIDLLSEVFGDNLVVVGIHAGVFSLPPMQTEAGNEYNKHFAISSYPKGLINRTLYKGSKEVDYNNWGEAIGNEILKKPKVSISADKVWDATDNSLKLDVSVKKDVAFDIDNTSLLIWLTESNIVAPQSMPDGTVKSDYVHNHVLRDAINGTWGSELKFENNISQSSINYSFEDKKWELEHCDIIIFVFDTDSKEVIETIKLPLID